MRTLRGAGLTRRSLADIKPLIALSAAYWGAMLLADPAGPFLLNDEWAYAAGVRRLLETGRLEPPPASFATALGQSAWGGLACALFGYSHTALRYSTVLLSWLGLLAFYASLRRLGSSAGQALLGAASLAALPLFFVMSGTFMTDAPALSLMLAAGLALIIGVQEDDDRWLAAASLAAALGYTIRQTAAALPVGAALCLAAAGERRPWRYAALLGPLAGVVAFHAVGTGESEALRGYALPAALSYLARPRQLASGTLARVAGACLALGVFLAPFWALKAGSRAGHLQEGRWRPGRPALAVAVLWALCLVIGQWPASGNVLGRFGVGTCSLGSSCGFKPSGIFWYPAFWWLYTLAGVAGSFVLASCWGELSRASPAVKAYAAGFVLAFAVSLASASYFDRYLLPLFPALIAVLAPRARVSWGRIAAVAAFALWSVAGTMDYMSWNRAKWEAGERLHRLGYGYEAISNGLDWDAHFGFEKAVAGRRPSDLALGWWDESNYSAFTSFAPASTARDIAKVGAVEYWSPLGWRRASISMWVKK